MLTDTIAAIATPLQAGAISIIKISGDQALAKVSTIFSKNLTKLAANTINYGHIYDGENIVDEVLVSIFKAPYSYTCEDVVEINCHGGVYVTKKVLALILGTGIRLALPGEFTSRAFLNGRIDLTQAEAANDLILAQNEYSSRQAIAGLGGSIQHLIQPIIDQLLAVIGTIEVNIDYPEYDDVTVLSHEMVLPHLHSWQTQLKQLITQAEMGRVLKTGVKTAIIGKPNVGKSSLFNALLKEDKAIVTEIEGTTRDWVEGVVRLNNVTLHLIDTAGIRHTYDIVEQIGIDKTKQAIAEAELIIMVISEDRISVEEQQVLDTFANRPHIIVNNKADLWRGSHLNISALKNEIAPLINQIEALFEQNAQVRDLEVLNNERQIGLAKEAATAIDQALAAVLAAVDLDLVVLDLELAYFLLKDILGESSRDDLLDTLFSNFCLGK